MLQEHARLDAEIKRREKQTAAMDRLVGARRACLASGAPTDTAEHRALLDAVLALCTPAEREQAADLLADAWPPWVLAAFRDAAAGGGS